MTVIYLEPRKTFDKALIDKSTGLYSFTKIIAVLIDCGMEWIDAIDYYCFNIEPLIMYKGLKVKEDDC